MEDVGKKGIFSKKVMLDVLSDFLLQPRLSPSVMHLIHFRETLSCWFKFKGTSVFSLDCSGLPRLLQL